MTTPSDLAAQPETRVRPRGVWYLLVVVLWVASVVVGVTVIASIVHVVDHGVTSFQASQQVNVPSSGLTVYSRIQPDSKDCTLTDGSGQQTAMDGLSFDLSATINGRSVYAVASTPDDLAAGSYRITCQGVGGSQLYYGDKFPIGSILIRSGISALLGVAGLALLILLLIRRHLSKSRIRTQQLMATTPAGYGTFQPYQPPPAYQPPPPQYPQQAPPPYPPQYPPSDGGPQS